MDDRVERVELVWPNKHRNVRVYQDADGRWAEEAVPFKAALRGLEDLEWISGSVQESASFVISGQRHDALAMLRRSWGPVFRLIYLDLPRLSVDDAAAEFQSVSNLRL